MTVSLGKQVMKSWAIGLAVSGAATTLDVISVHTPLQVFAIFLTALRSPASFVLAGIERQVGLATTTSVVYATEILSGSIIYGAIFFLVIRIRSRHRPSDGVGRPTVP